MSDNKENLQKILDETKSAVELATSQIAKVCVIRNRVQKTPIDETLTIILREIREVSREKAKFVGKAWDEKIAKAKEEVKNEA